MFGLDGPAHVVFSAGFPAVGKEEFEATRRVAVEAGEHVSPSAVCRGTPADVLEACRAVAGSPHARVMIVVPSSDQMADAMLHRPAAEALRATPDLVRMARDAFPDVVPDVCFADAPRADVGLIAERAEAVTDAGAGVVLVADTIGDLMPHQTAQLFGRLKEQVSDQVVLASHLHNDLGLALANTLEVIRSGVRVVSSSWLGIAERSGLVATEQLLYLLAAKSEACGVSTAWWTEPDLARLSAIARAVSAETGIPLLVTTPIVGTGVGTISTGTPFVRPATFQPFDPRTVGITPTVVLTQLASARVLEAVAERIGYPALDSETIREALQWVKSEAYRRNTAVVPDADLARFLGARRNDAMASPHGAEPAGRPAVGVAG